MLFCGVLLRITSMTGIKGLIGRFNFGWFLNPLKDNINCKYFTTKVIVLYQVSKEIEAKIQV